MKTLTSFLIASTFLFLTAQSAFAENPVVQTLDRHAVWSKGDTRASKRDMTRIHIPNGSPRAVSYEGKKESTLREGWADFVHETKTYDYAKDHGHSA